MPPIGPLCAVLAGGLGSRMGQPKPLVELAGRRLIDYPIESARRAGLETVVVAKGGSALPPLEVVVVEEPREPRHPLCGIVAALQHGRGRDIVVVGCDMPFVTAEVLAALAALEDHLAVPSVGGRLEPLLARYGSELLDPLVQSLGAMRPLYETISVLAPTVLGDEWLSGFGDSDRLAFNINDAADLSRAETLLSEGPEPSDETEFG